MFSGQQNESWDKFHNRYGNVIEDPADRRSMMSAAMSSMGSSARNLGKAVVGGSSSTAMTGKALANSGPRPNMSRTKSQRSVSPRPNLSRHKSMDSTRQLSRNSSARNLTISKGGRAARGCAPVKRTSSSSGLQALKGALTKQKSSSGDLDGASMHTPRKPRRSASPMPERSRSPVRPSRSSELLQPL